MNISLFYHSLVSDWNNGNAHFLRGIVTELKKAEHRVTVYEPAGGWSFQNLRQDSPIDPEADFLQYYPDLKDAYIRYPEDFDPMPVLENSDLVIIHEWNDPELVRRIAKYRKNHSIPRLLFHDTHHRAFSQAATLDMYHLEHFDGILAYGESIRRIYLEKGWNRRVWTWHEAADTRIFHPVPRIRKEGDLVWIGNWGDEERTAEYMTYFLEPVASLQLSARAYGVRYPAKGLALLENAGVAYGGRLANYRVPEVYSGYSVTLHIPRRPYVRHLPGIPTIRPFEALSCGIPLVSAPWDDAEGLFTPGSDFLMARDGREMKSFIEQVLHDENLRQSLIQNGRSTILERHTCRHRVEQLMSICEELNMPVKKRIEAETRPVLQEVRPEFGLRR